MRGLIRLWTWPVALVGHIAIVLMIHDAVLHGSAALGGRLSGCVRLPNGVLVTRDAWTFNFANPYWRTDYAVRDPGGRLLTLGDGSELRVSGDTVIWRDDAAVGRGGWLTYAPRRGFVRERDDAARFERVRREGEPYGWAEAGLPHRISGIDHKFRVSGYPRDRLGDVVTGDCHAPLFTFARTGL